MIIIVSFCCWLPSRSGYFVRHSGLYVCALSSPILFVDLIAKANRVNNGQFEADVGFLQVVCSRPQIHAVLVMARLFVLKHGVKERVH